MEFTKMPNTKAKRKGILLSTLHEPEFLWPLVRKSIRKMRLQTAGEWNCSTKSAQEMLPRKMQVPAMSRPSLPGAVGHKCVKEETFSWIIHAHNLASWSPPRAEVASRSLWGKWPPKAGRPVKDRWLQQAPGEGWLSGGLWFDPGKHWNCAQG